MNIYMQLIHANYRLKTNYFYYRIGIFVCKRVKSVDIKDYKEFAILFCASRLKQMEVFIRLIPYVKKKRRS